MSFLNFSSMFPSWGGGGTAAKQEHRVRRTIDELRKERSIEHQQPHQFDGLRTVGTLRIFDDDGNDIDQVASEILAMRIEEEEKGLQEDKIDRQLRSISGGIVVPPFLRAQQAAAEPPLSPMPILSLDPLLALSPSSLTSTPSPSRPPVLHQYHQPTALLPSTPRHEQSSPYTDEDEVSADFLEELLHEVTNGGDGDGDSNDDYYSEMQKASEGDGTQGDGTQGITQVLGRVGNRPDSGSRTQHTQDELQHDDRWQSTEESEPLHSGEQGQVVLERQAMQTNWELTTRQLKGGSSDSAENGAVNLATLHGSESSSSDATTVTTNTTINKISRRVTLSALIAARKGSRNGSRHKDRFGFIGRSSFRKRNKARAHQQGQHLSASLSTDDASTQGGRIFSSGSDVGIGRVLKSGSSSSTDGTSRSTPIMGLSQGGLRYLIGPPSLSGRAKYSASSPTRAGDEATTTMLDGNKSGDISADEDRVDDIFSVRSRASNKNDGSCNMTDECTEPLKERDDESSADLSDSVVPPSAGTSSSSSEEDTASDERSTMDTTLSSSPGGTDGARIIDHANSRRRRESGVSPSATSATSSTPATTWSSDSETKMSEELVAIATVTVSRKGRTNGDDDQKNKQRSSPGFGGDERGRQKQRRAHSKQEQRDEDPSPRKEAIDPPTMIFSNDDGGESHSITSDQTSAVTSISAAAEKTAGSVLQRYVRSELSELHSDILIMKKDLSTVAAELKQEGAMMLFKGVCFVNSEGV